MFIRIQQFVMTLISTHITSNSQLLQMETFVSPFVEGSKISFVFGLVTMVVLVYELTNGNLSVAWQPPYRLLFIIMC